MMSIRKGILFVLRNGRVHHISEIRRYVKTFYKSRTGWGQDFLIERVSEELYKLVNYDKIVVKVRRGFYKLK